LLEAAHLAPADDDFFVQALAPLPVLADARAQVRLLLGEHVDLALLRLDAAVALADALAQRDEVAFDVGDAPVRRGGLLPQFAQLALARQDAGLGVVRTDRQRAVSLQQFAPERHAAAVRAQRGDGPRGGEVAHDQGAAQEARR